MSNITEALVGLNLGGENVVEWNVVPVDYSEKKYDILIKERTTFYTVRPVLNKIELRLTMKKNSIFVSWMVHS